MPMLSATSATNFTVTGSVTGSLPAATVGTPYSEGEIAFTITAGGEPFVSSDEFTLSTAPKWTVKRKARRCSILATSGNTGAQAAQNLIDGKTAIDTSKCFRAPGAAEPFDIVFEFADAEMIASYELVAYSTAYESYMPKAWDFDYWTGSAWVTLDSVSDQTYWGATEVRSFDVGTPVSANKYRIHVTTLGSSYLGIGAVRLRRAGGVDAAFSGAIWEAPGNDGDSEILVGVHLFERYDADYFNWEVCGFDGYQENAAFYQQAGFHGSLYLPLWEDSIPYWFVADGRRVIVVAKLNTQYEVAYLGLLDSYFTPDQWPYPLALGGALAFGPTVPGWESVRFRWTNDTDNHRAFPLGGPTTQSYRQPEYRQCRARDWSGVYLGFMGTAGDDVPYDTEDAHFIWPACCGFTLLDENLDGSYQLWPAILNTDAPNTIGEIAGVQVVTGQGLTAETLIERGAVNWMVFHNIARTDRDDFFAVALD